MTALLCALLAALGVAELIGALTKYPTISEMIDQALKGKAIWIRVAFILFWTGLGIHLFFGWLQ